jgi:hypothetical protein
MLIIKKNIKKNQTHFDFLIFFLAWYLIILVLMIECLFISGTSRYLKTLINFLNGLTKKNK